MILLFVYFRDSERGADTLPRDHLAKQVQTPEGSCIDVCTLFHRRTYTHGARKFNIFVYQSALTRTRRETSAVAERVERKEGQDYCFNIAAMSSIVVTSTYPSPSNHGTLPLCPRRRRWNAVLMPRAHILAVLARVHPRRRFAVIKPSPPSYIPVSFATLVLVWHTNRKMLLITSGYRRDLCNSLKIKRD